MIQNYNKATNEGFSQVCKATEMQCGERHEHICTMDRMSMKYRTVYKMLVDDNCTEKQLLERFRKGNSTVTGRIFRWNIADIFDVPQWHASSQDCSHFCVVPVSLSLSVFMLYLLLVYRQSLNILLHSIRSCMKPHLNVWIFYCLHSIELIV